MGFKGKTINFLGDSITEGAGASCIENCYVSILERNSGFAEVRNYGIGGTRIAPNYTVSPDPKWDKDFISRADSMKNADLIVVFGGTLSKAYVRTGLCTCDVSRFFCPRWSARLRDFG